MTPAVFTVYTVEIAQIIASIIDDGLGDSLGLGLCEDGRLESYEAPDLQDVQNGMKGLDILLPAVIVEYGTNDISLADETSPTEARVVHYHYKVHYLKRKATDGNPDRAMRQDLAKITALLLNNVQPTAITNLDGVSDRWLIPTSEGWAPEDGFYGVAENQINVGLIEVLVEVEQQPVGT